MTDDHVHEYAIHFYVLKCTACEDRKIVNIDHAGHFEHMANSVHQGSVDSETATLGDELTEDQKRLVKNILPCRHPESDIESCNCPSSGAGFRCRACGLRSDSKDVFARLRGR